MGELGGWVFIRLSDASFGFRVCGGVVSISRAKHNETWRNGGAKIHS